MSPIEKKIAFLRQTEEAATPEPWLAVDGGITYFKPGMISGVFLIQDRLLLKGHCNIQVVTVSRNHLRALIAVAEAVATALGEMPGYMSMCDALAALAELPDA